MLQSVEWSRAQFALTAIYHWLFVPLTLGLSVLCALMETRYYRTGDPFWRSTTKFWMRLFGINFAIGVATGLILEFEFGTNWSNYSNFVGDIFGAPLAIEGIMAFFLESTFVAVMFFGWDKVSRGFHLSATWLTAIGANLSALWILVANSWMQYPVGCSFNIATVRNEMDSFWDVLFSEGQRTCDDDAFYFKIGIPKLLSLMSFRSADAFVPGINDLVYGNEERGILSTAEKMSRGRHAIDQLGRYHEAREKGDEAAMHEVERLFDASTPEGAAFLRDYYAYFGYGYLRSPQETVPNVPLVFYSFRVMVGAGCFFILLCAVVWWLNRRDRLAGKRWLLRVMILSIPLAYLASQAGWIVAEVGRQPWTIQNLLPACVSGSHIAATPVAVTFFIFLALFTVLLAAELAIMLRQIKIGPNE